MVNKLNLIVTVEVTNRFKGLDLGDGVPVLVKNCGQRFITLDRRQ